MTRLACDPRTREYMERRTKEGRSKREVIRVLKRYVALGKYLSTFPAMGSPSGGSGSGNPRRPPGLACVRSAGPLLGTIARNATTCGLVRACPLPRVAHDWFACSVDAIELNKPLDNRRSFGRSALVALFDTTPVAGPFTPFSGAGLLTRFEVILQGDEEALGLGHHLEPVPPKLSADWPRRPPSEKCRTLEAGVEGSNLCVAVAKRREPVTHAWALGVVIEDQIVLGLLRSGDRPLAGAGSTHAVKMGGTTHHE